MGKTYHPKHKKAKRENIYLRFDRYFTKRLNWKGRLALVTLVLAIVIPIVCAFLPDGKAEENVETVPAVLYEAPAETAAPVEYIFRNGENGAPFNWQTLTEAWAHEAGLAKRYDLTDAERWEIASVVTAEAKGEPYAGKMAVAQCILQACEDDNLRPIEALTEYRYTSSRPDPTAEALAAVQAVFDFGQVVTGEPIKYFYAPAISSGAWHETQDYVLTINGHKFFAEAKDQ